MPKQDCGERRTKNTSAPPRAETRPEARTRLTNELRALPKRPAPARKCLTQADANGRADGPKNLFGTSHALTSNTVHSKAFHENGLRSPPHKKGKSTQIHDYFALVR